MTPTVASTSLRPPPRHASAPCLHWLDSKAPASVVCAVSFGSLAVLDADQMTELALGLFSSRKHFLWVVRPSEGSELPPDFLARPERVRRKAWSYTLLLAAGGLGTWSNRVLPHALLLELHHGSAELGGADGGHGPPKYIEEVRRVGLRARVREEEGMAGREEVERCMREVMEGGGAGGRMEEMRRKGSWQRRQRRRKGA